MADPKDPIEGPQEASRRNPFAIAGLALGVVSFFLFSIGLIPILAIVFSSIGLAKSGNYQGAGRVQAWIGLVLGIVYTVVYLYHYGHLA